MARIKIDLPDKFPFSVSIPIRITDINYGGHVGNDTVLSLIHEARVQFLQHQGYKELEIEGIGLIMSDAVIEFKLEIFYGDILKVSVCPADFSRAGFDLYYKLEKETEEKTILVAAAKTGMICYNYDLKKIVRVPEKLQATLSR
jgi:acyl-CoA thioester hydrolase